MAFTRARSQPKSSKTKVANPSTPRKSLREVSSTSNSSDQEYEVEKILNMRVRQQITEYRVKWTGYNNRYNRWMPQESLKKCKSLIQKYHKKNNGSLKRKQSLPTTPSKNPKRRRTNPDNGLPESSEIIPGYNHINLELSNDREKIETRVAIFIPREVFIQQCLDTAAGRVRKVKFSQLISIYDLPQDDEVESSADIDSEDNGDEGSYDGVNEFENDQDFDSTEDDENLI